MAICSPHNGFAIAVVLAIVDFFYHSDVLWFIDAISVVVVLYSD